MNYIHQHSSVNERLKSVHVIWIHVMQLQTRRSAPESHQDNEQRIVELYIVNDVSQVYE